MRTARIITLNIWNRGGPWEERLAAIRAGVANLEPDVIGLQEVLRPASGDGFDQALQIADGFGYHIAFGVAMKTSNLASATRCSPSFPSFARKRSSCPSSMPKSRAA